jgi:rSAM/selenodomain-associated transferase 1
LLTETLRRLVGARLAPVELRCAPDTSHPLFKDLSRTHGLALRPQTGGDLGDRLWSASVECLRGAGSVVLVGADCPSLDGHYVRSALEALARVDAVLGPAEDGGYVLLGLKQAAPGLFSGIPWGTGEVAAITRERMTSLGWSWAELPTLWDLDRPEDLVRLPTRG